MKEVLIVEDDERMREIIHILIMMPDLIIEDAINGKIALEKIAKKKYDLIILDVMMPLVDGFTVLKEMKENSLNSETPVIILTCKTEDKDILRGYEYGAEYYITKPFESKELLESIESVLRIKILNN